MAAASLPAWSTVSPSRESLLAHFRVANSLSSFDPLWAATEDKHYYEIAQFLTQAHNLHWTPERRAWCPLDGNGDVEDVIKWTEAPGRSGYETATCITIDREVVGDADVSDRIGPGPDV